MRQQIECSALLALLVLSGCLNAADTQEKTIQSSFAMLRQAEEQLMQGNYAEAASKARAAAAAVADSPDVLQAAAEVLYRSGESKESLPLFDKVVKLVPDSAPYNWQRGIALCSAERWKDGAEQFKTHHDVNPNDVENSAWYFLCVAKVDGIEAARKTVIPSQGDGRQPMMSVLQMLKQELEPDDVLAAAINNTAPGPGRQMAKFYADLYVGLYFDSLNDADRAKQYLERSLTYDVNGYMEDVARVYLKDRFSGKSPADNKKE